MCSILHTTRDSRLSMLFGERMSPDNPKNERKTRICNKYVSLLTDSSRAEPTTVTILINYCNNSDYGGSEVNTTPPQLWRRHVSPKL
jgi:hypothetical protein